MEKYVYEADGGTIQLGNDIFTCCLPNSFGDGEFCVFITKNGEMSTRNFTFRGSIEGIFNVYQYDCDTEKILTTLSGRYGIFSKNGIIILEQW